MLQRHEVAGRGTAAAAVGAAGRLLLCPVGYRVVAVGYRWPSLDRHVLR